MPSCSLATISKKTPSLLTSLATNGLSVTAPCNVMLKRLLSRESRYDFKTREKHEVVLVYQGYGIAGGKRRFYSGYRRGKVDIGQYG